MADWLSYLEQLHPKSIALGLDRVNLVCDRLALAPEFPVITVAGTNGKGSTCAMLERIYLEAGYRVGCYTSPHLLHYNERVRLDGVEASDEELCLAFAAVESVRRDVPLTYFEFGTLAAMWHFIRADVDVAILEVGLGGRLDAVNIFKPACAIVTSVDLDHMDYLGDSRDSIGAEKAGIYRAGVPAICADPIPPSTLVEYAASIGADFRQIDDTFNYVVHAHGWDFYSSGWALTGLPLPALSGGFQLQNASCVIEAVLALEANLPVGTAAIHAGLRNVALRGRFQQLHAQPDIILDVAHNPHAARALADNLREHPVPGRTIAVCAMLADKDIAGVVGSLQGHIDAWYVASIHAPRGATAELLATSLHDIGSGTMVRNFDDVKSAFRQACLDVGEDDRIIVFGSFYTVADVLGELPGNLGDAWLQVR